MKSVNNLAGRILSNPALERGGPPKVSLATIILVLKVIVMAYECFRKFNFDTKDVRRPGLLARWKVRRLTRTVLAEQGAEDELDRVLEALYSTTETLSFTEMVDVISEVEAS